MDVKKIKNFKSQINYDSSADVLYLSFGNPRTAISKEVFIGNFVRIDPFTDEIIGITILDFKEHYMSTGSINTICCGSNSKINTTYCNIK